MKKTLLAAILAVAASAASAGVTGFTTYDYNALAGGKGSTQEAVVGVAVNTSVGTFDGGVVGNRVRLGAQDDTLGFEVGYTNGLKLLNGQLAGRAAYGRKNQVNGAENIEYYSLGAEFTAPVAKDVGLFVGYRHRNTFNTSTEFAENRYSVGADFALTKNVQVRAGYAHTVVGGANFNGVTTAISYKF